MHDDRRRPAALHDAARLIDAGVHQITSNDPDRLAALIEEIRTR
jgi:hypothetical protein